MTKLFAVLALWLTMSFVQSSTKDQDNDISSKSKEVLLTKHPWRMDELLQVENNAQTYYKRGGDTNTIDCDEDVLTFNMDGRGTYEMTSFRSYPITWTFTNTEKTQLGIVIKFGPSSNISLTCSDVELSKTRFFCVSSFMNESSQPVLNSVTRTK